MMDLFFIFSRFHALQYNSIVSYLKTATSVGMANAIWLLLQHSSVISNIPQNVLALLVYMMWKCQKKKKLQATIHASTVEQTALKSAGPDEHSKDTNSRMHYNMYDGFTI